MTDYRTSSHKPLTIIALLIAITSTALAQGSTFPDTVMPSATHIIYTVHYHDTAHSGVISNPQSLFPDNGDILTFRGNAFRSAPFTGVVAGQPDTIMTDWTFTTDYDARPNGYGLWGGGNGWTGQPLFVCWNDSMYHLFRNDTVNTTHNFGHRELIIASLCSRLYFINFDNGKESRQSIFVGNPIKGTPTMDPTYNGNIYIGHGVPCQTPFGAVTVNLFRHGITHVISQDDNAWRSWGAFDSSPVRVGDFLFRPGENGTLYKFRIDADTLILHSTLRFILPEKEDAGGIEASMAVYRNYGFLADNHGNIVCVDLNDLQPVWHYNNHDDTDASLLLQQEGDSLFLYTGCEVDNQGLHGYCFFVKLNATTGLPVWEQKLPCQKAKVTGKYFDGGLFSTPLPGIGNCKDLIFLNLVTNETPGPRGEFVALNRHDGSIAYRTKLQRYAWSSPVAMVNEKDEVFVFTADTQGRVYLINGMTGKIIISKKIGENFEASPIVVGNNVIIGSRGRKIYKLSIMQSPFAKAAEQYNW
ncbi:MAG: PQQ-binding-like beta-propeller repeat protein [Bacteroidales bacterium]|nr:PQQ-binding-like beta-propeller repeat protein [Bacteroidales bacterium]